METNLRDKFNKEKKELESKIRELEMKVNELQDYEEKQHIYNQEMAQLKDTLAKERKEKQFELSEMERGKI